MQNIHLINDSIPGKSVVMSLLSLLILIIWIVSLFSLVCTAKSLLVLLIFWKNQLLVSLMFLYFSVLYTVSFLLLVLSLVHCFCFFVWGLFCLCLVACRILVSPPRIDPKRWQWKCHGLTTGLPRNSHTLLFFKFCKVEGQVIDMKSFFFLNLGIYKFPSKPYVS